MTPYKFELSPAGEWPRGVAKLDVVQGVIKMLQSDAMKPKIFSLVVDLKEYSTDPKRSILLAGDNFYDGKKYERDGNKNTFLYKVKNRENIYFIAALSQNATDTPPEQIIPLNQSEAINHYERLYEKYVDFQNAFPGIEIEKM